MNPLLMAGSVIVTFALLFYSIGIIAEQRIHKLTRKVLIFVTLGIIFDITATLFMIIGSPNSPFTLHGFLGYSALAVMLVDVSLIWRLNRSSGTGSEVPHNLHLYSRYAYFWWVVAYITGALLVILN